MRAALFFPGTGKYYPPQAADGVRLDPRAFGLCLSARDDEARHCCRRTPSARFAGCFLRHEGPSGSHADVPEKRRPHGDA